jgi:PAS domain-containing protein
MDIAASAMLAPETALLAGLSGFVFATLFFGLVPARRRTRGRDAAAEHPRFWQMLLWQGGQAVAVLDRAGDCFFACGKGTHYLDGCRAQLAPSLAALTRDGVGFDRELVLSGNERLRVTGRPVGRRAVLYFAPETRNSTAEAQMRQRMAAHSALVRRLPVAVAAFTADRRLWAFSDAYAELWGLSQAELDRQPFEDELLDRLRETGQLPEQDDFPLWKRRQLRQAIGACETWHLPGGRTLRVTRQAAADGRLVVYEDVSRQLALETENSLHRQVQKATLDTLDEGVAIFGPDGRLLLGNACFAAQWGLTEGDMLRLPHHAELAAASAARLGPDGIWDLVALGANALEAAAMPGPRTLRRADGRTFLVTLSRLPNGTTMAGFLDLGELERFEAMLAEDRAASAPGRKSGDRQG